MKARRVFALETMIENPSDRPFPPIPIRSWQGDSPVFAPVFAAVFAAVRMVSSGRRSSAVSDPDPVTSSEKKIR